MQTAMNGKSGAWCSNEIEKAKEILSQMEMLDLRIGNLKVMAQEFVYNRLAPVMRPCPPDCKEEGIEPLLPVESPLAITLFNFERTVNEILNMVEDGMKRLEV